MKTTFLKSVMAVLVALFSLNANAYDVEIDGIYYNLVEKAQQAEVTYGDNIYTGEVVIPERIVYNDVEYRITSIGDMAFRNSSSMTSIVIPNSITFIGLNAFYGCTGLTSVVIPNSMTTLGSSIFRRSGLISITIPNSVTLIESMAFYDCI